MAKANVDVPDQLLRELENYKDRMGELLMLGLSQDQNPGVPVHVPSVVWCRWEERPSLAHISEREMIHQARAAGMSPVLTRRRNSGLGTKVVVVYPIRPPHRVGQTGSCWVCSENFMA